MSVHERLASMERRIEALEALVKDMAAEQVAVIEAIEDEDRPAPVITLDGEEVGTERDQDQPL
jgi:hypothetical protein